MTACGGAPEAGAGRENLFARNAIFGRSFSAMFI